MILSQNIRSEQINLYKYYNGCYGLLVSFINPTPDITNEMAESLKIQ